MIFYGTMVVLMLPVATAAATTTDRQGPANPSGGHGPADPSPLLVDPSGSSLDLGKSLVFIIHGK